MLTLVLLACLATTNAYIWPSPQLDELERQRWEQDLASFVIPCTTFIFDDSGHSGRSNAADWLRTAYHDMATHNVADETGGIDGSIRFDEEMARPEVKLPVHVYNSLTVFRAGVVADSLALAAVIAIENWWVASGGPEIAFRGGRVDALEPNTPGVPQPQQNLHSHIASFARQGFTQTEMIGLVACGHTFGGVQHEQFPHIVPELNDPNNNLSVAHFDSTFVTFDNNIASEYILGTTQDPLVVGLNDTTNSDKRIFGSDGNFTMRSFAESPELYASTCADLFARMIDTVPRGVQLTEVITPLPVKPTISQLVLHGDTLELSGQVRFWNMTVDMNHTVQMLWDDHTGSTNNLTLPVEGRPGQGIPVAGGRHRVGQYAFGPDLDHNLVFNATAGITTMRFVVDNKLEDQGGIGFAVQDSVVFNASTCIVFNGGDTGIIRNTITPKRVYVGFESLDNTFFPSVVEFDVPRPSKPVAANAVYSIWSAEVTMPATLFINFYSLSADINGVNGTETLNGPFQQGIQAC
ncbi:heme peroxidase [Mycena capillaripes]|nr:heme peroxidase [Mycena capillaripes]